MIEKLDIVLRGQQRAKGFNYLFSPLTIMVATVNLIMSLTLAIIFIVLANRNIAIPIEHSRASDALSPTYLIVVKMDGFPDLIYKVRRLEFEEHKRDINVLMDC